MNDAKKTAKAKRKAAARKLGRKARELCHLRARDLKHRTMRTSISVDEQDTFAQIASDAFFTLVPKSPLSVGAEVAAP